MGVFRGYRDRAAATRQPHQGKAERARRLRQATRGGRVDIQAILADPDQRQSLLARAVEGIKTIGKWD